LSDKNDELERELEIPEIPTGEEESPAKEGDQNSDM
jgi:hypothetical protein